jgi:RNA polymerase sigma factor (sigma-70 family)
MENSEVQINYLVKLSQSTNDRDEKKEAISKIIEMLKPFRYALAKKFANKGVEFDDIAQQIDLKLIEAIYDYDEKKDPNALRHLVSKTRNGIWNYYRKEMNYFDEDKSPVSLDAIVAHNEMGIKTSYYDFVDDKSKTFDEDQIIEKILLEEELAKITPHQREVLFMIFVDDMTQYSIAEELNINQANVSRAKRRGIENIKNNISLLDEPDEID